MPLLTWEYLWSPFISWILLNEIIPKIKLYWMKLSLFIFLSLSLSFFRALFLLSFSSLSFSFSLSLSFSLLFLLSPYFHALSRCLLSPLLSYTRACVTGGRRGRFFFPLSLFLLLSSSREGEITSPSLTIFLSRSPSLQKLIISFSLSCVISFSLPPSSSFLSFLLSPRDGNCFRHKRGVRRKVLLSPLLLHFFLSLARAHVCAISLATEIISVAIGVLPLPLPPSHPLHFSLSLSLFLSPLLSSMLSQFSFSLDLSLSLSSALFPALPVSSLLLLSPLPFSLLHFSLLASPRDGNFFRRKENSFSSFPLSLSHDRKSPSRDCGLSLSLSFSSVPPLSKLPHSPPPSLPQVFFGHRRERREKREKIRERREERENYLFLMRALPSGMERFDRRDLRREKPDQRLEIIQIKSPIFKKLGLWMFLLYTCSIG